MELLQERLSRCESSGGTLVGYEGYRSYLCLFGFDQVFPLPHGTKTIWLTAHNRPANERVAISHASDPKLAGRNYFHVEGRGVVQFHWDTVAILQRLLHNRKSVYIECEYSMEDE